MSSFQENDPYINALWPTLPDTIISIILPRAPMKNPCSVLITSCLRIFSVCKQRHGGPTCLLSSFLGLDTQSIFLPDGKAKYNTAIQDRTQDTCHNLGVCLDPTHTFQPQISSICRICCLKLRRISALHHYLSKDVTKKTCVHLFFQD